MVIALCEGAGRKPQGFVAMYDAIFAGFSYDTASIKGEQALLSVGILIWT